VREAAVDAKWDEFDKACQDSLLEQVKGDPEPFLALWSQKDDVAIMGADGSLDRGFEPVKHGIEMAATALKAQERTADRLLTLVDGEIAVTVEIEKVTKEVGDKSITIPLRCTQVYRVEDGEWRIILRHADQFTPEGPRRGGPPAHGGGPPGGGPPGGGPPGGGPPGGGPPGGGPPGGGPPG
jgi:hypothetical protein